MMYRLHKEGQFTVTATSLMAMLLGYLLLNYAPPIIQLIGLSVIILLYLWVVSFFRNPKRLISQPDPNKIWAPADGKIVTIEQTTESEYFKDERIQISIFMSIFNVHVNRSPIDAEVPYSKYHPGKFLVAWHPKSSTENERNTIVLKNQKHEILIRQIAGALARRIVCYLKKGDQIKAGKDVGFIKFGSRVDIFLPLDTQINVKIGDKVKGNLTCLAEVN